VQLQVLQGRANAANLVSGVAKPGVYPLPDSDYTLLSLLAEGGGVEQGLKNPQVRLMRGGSVYGISVSRLFGDPGLDTTLRGGDRVIVEEDSRYFLSLGAAGSEALHVFPKDQVSALDALSLIGGVQDSRANPRGILILREYPRTALRKDGRGPGQERVVFTLDLTSADGLFSAGRFAVLPGDLVYATESRLTSAKTVFGLIGSVLGIAANAQDL
jgi:polysaccharide export outer membrane protein